jgi:hypothetical protein
MRCASNVSSLLLGVDWQAACKHIVVRWRLHRLKTHADPHQVLKPRSSTESPFQRPKAQAGTPVQLQKHTGQEPQQRCDSHWVLQRGSATQQGAYEIRMCRKAPYGASCTWLNPFR